MEELCCFAAIGELSPAEQRELDVHLSQCRECRTVQTEFQKIAALDLSRAAAARTAKSPVESTVVDGSDRLLTLILEKAKENREAMLPKSGSRLRAWWHRTADSITGRLIFGGLSTVATVCIVGAIAFRIFWSAHVPDPGTLSWAPEIVQQNAIVQQSREEVLALAARNQSLQTELALLRKEKVARASELARLEAASENSLATQTSLRQQLDNENTEIKALGAQLQSTQTSLAQERANSLVLKAQLDNTTSQENLRRVAFHEIAPSLPAPAALDPRPSVTEEDARELFGARDLHIVDVYDVDRSGKTQKPYGRVYYVDHRLLLFYAFDLGNRKKGHTLASFQAWGYRAPHSSAPENLGLFHVDDAALNRWVLRVTNSDVLTRIDTVFVTLEPLQGSSYPSSQKLLIASLAGPANHP